MYVWLMAYGLWCWCLLRVMKEEGKKGGGKLREEKLPGGFFLVLIHVEKDMYLPFFFFTYYYYHPKVQPSFSLFPPSYFLPSIHLFATLSEVLSGATTGAGVPGLVFVSVFSSGVKQSVGRL